MYHQVIFGTRSESNMNIYICKLVYFVYIFCKLVQSLKAEKAVLCKDFLKLKIPVTSRVPKNNVEMLD